MSSGLEHVSTEELNVVLGNLRAVARRCIDLVVEKPGTAHLPRGTKGGASLGELYQHYVQMEDTILQELTRREGGD